MTTAQNGAAGAANGNAGGGGGDLYALLGLGRDATQHEVGALGCALRVSAGDEGQKGAAVCCTTATGARQRSTARTRARPRQRPPSKRRRVRHQTCLTIQATAHRNNHKQIRRAFKTLRAAAHPDKGGDAAAFVALTRAFDVLSDPQRRAHYDRTGRVRVGADEAFIASFGGGAFADPLRRGGNGGANGAPPPPGDAVVVRAEEGAAGRPSHTAGFEAWLRARGGPGGGASGNGSVFGAEQVAEQFGVVKSSYDAVPTPRAAGGGPARVPGVVCRGAGAPSATLALGAEALPPELGWGEVLVVWLAAPVGPGDVYSLRLGGVYGAPGAAAAPPRLPFAAGHDGVGVVARVGPGVKGTQLAEGDLVSPAAPFLGTWRAACVCRAKALARVGSLAGAAGGGGGGAPAWLEAANGGGAAAAAIIREAAAAAVAATAPGGAGGDTDANASSSPPLAPEAGGPPLLPLEYLCVARELTAAHRLLEAAGGGANGLRPGDCVALNAPDSTVGRAALQLARLLRLRVVALLRPRPARNGTGGNGNSANGNGNNTAGGKEGQTDEARFEAVAARLRALGATAVLRDEGAARPQLEALGPGFGARPVLALDAVGGDSAARLADLLADVSYELGGTGSGTAGDSTAHHAPRTTTICQHARHTVPPLAPPSRHRAARSSSTAASRGARLLSAGSTLSSAPSPCAASTRAATRPPSRARRRARWRPSRASWRPATCASTSPSMSAALRMAWVGRRSGATPSSTPPARAARRAAAPRRCCCCRGSRRRSARRWRRATTRRAAAAVLAATR